MEAEPTTNTEIIATQLNQHACVLPTMSQRLRIRQPTPTPLPKPHMIQLEPRTIRNKAPATSPEANNARAKNTQPNTCQLHTCYN